MPRKIKLILNPTANHGRSGQVASDLRPLAAEHKAEWSGTKYPGQSSELAVLGCQIIKASHSRI